MNKFFCVALLTLLSSQAFGQNTIFAQTNSRTYGLSNFAEPKKAVDSFLGQDKKGPYVLSWNNFVFGPGNPVWVHLDNNLLRTSEYTLDVIKGEITFDKYIKRTQFVRVEYGYYPEISGKNANPALTAPLTIKLTNNNLSGLTLTAFNNQNYSAAPSMVLGYRVTKGGFKSNYYSYPSGKNTDNAVNMSYNIGSVNNFSASYEKADKGFSPYAKSFGILDSAEKTNLGGAYSISKNSNLSFKNSSFKSLNSNVENNNTSAQFQMNGNKFQPSLNFSYNNSDSVDAKNSKVNSIVQNSEVNQNLGSGKFAYKSSNNDISTNGIRTVNNQETLSFKTNQFYLGRVQDFKIDPKNGTTANTSNYLNYSTKVSGGNANFSTNQTNSLVNNKESQNEQFNYNLTFAGNKSGFSGFNLFRFENNTNANNVQNNVTNDKVTFGFKSFSYNTNTVISQIGDIVRKDLIDNSLTYVLPTPKNAPSLSFSSTESVKRNDKGILVGSSNESTIFKHKINGLQFNFKLGQITAYSPNGSVVSTDNTTGNLQAKVGRGSIISETINNQIIADGKMPINQELNKFSYSINPSKNFPGFDYERADVNSVQDSNVTSSASDQFKIVSKIGSTSFNAFSILSINDVNSNRSSETKNNNISLNTPIWGQSSNLSVSLNTNNNNTINGEENKSAVSVNFSPSKSLSLSSEQSDSRILSNGQVTNSNTNNKVGFRWNSSDTLLQTSINTIDSGTFKSEIFDYRTVVGNDKTFLKLDSSVRMRESTLKDPTQNRDTTQTSLNISPFRNFKVSGTYVLNPDDPAKPGVINPIEKRTYALNAKIGHLNLDGFHTATEHLPGTSSDILAKAGGFNLYGETGLRLNYKFGSMILVSEMKDQFYYGTNYKGINSYSFGLTSSKLDRFNFSLSGTFMQNRNNSINSQDYKAEAKLGVKF
jgi:hypothetical protein